MARSANSKPTRSPVATRLPALEGSFNRNEKEPRQREYDIRTRSPRYSTSSTTPAVLVTVGYGNQAHGLGANKHQHIVCLTLLVRNGDATTEGFHHDVALGPSHDASLQGVDLTDEIGNEETCRMRVDLLRRSHLLHASAVHDHDAIRKAHGLVLVVRHVDRRRSQALLHVAGVSPRTCTRSLASRLESGSSNSSSVRLHDQRTRQRHALLLPARELAGKTRQPSVSSPTALFQSHRYVANARVLPDDLRTRSPNRRRSRIPTCAEIAHSSGTPCRRAVDAAAGTVSIVHQPEFRRRQRARAPPACATRSSCRIPMGRETVTNSPGSMRKLKSCTAMTLASSRQG